MNYPTKILSSLTVAAVCALTATGQTMTYADCVDYARAHNITLRKLEVTRQKSLNALSESKAQWEPTFDFTTTHTAGNTPWSDGDKNTYNSNYSLGAGWTVWDGGRRSATIKRDRLQLSIDSLDTSDALRSIETEILQAYVNILYAGENIEVCRQAVELSRAQAERAKALMEAGKLSRVDYTQLQSQYEQDRYSLVNAEGTYDSRRMEMKQILEMGIGSDLQLAPVSISDSEITAALPPIEESYTLAIDTDSRLRSLDLAYRSADYDISIAKAGRMPQISLSAGVGTQVTGIIDKLYADYNSIVKQGELIAEIEKTVLQSDYQSAEANVKSAELTYNYNLTNFNRDKQLHDRQLISDYEFETSKKELEVSKTAYDKAKADRVRAAKNFNYAEIYSPIDDIVISREVEVGQTVVSSMNVANLYTIADLDNMRVIGDVDEADIGRVKVGQEVTFSVDAYPDELFHGNVTQVRLNPTTESNVVTYEVVVDAANPEHKLIPGLTANLTIYVMKADNVILVPNSALTFEPEGREAPPTPGEGKRTLWVVEGDSLVATTVTIGDTNGIRTEIKSGIKAGDKVATWLVNVIAHWPVHIQVYSVALSFVVCTITGVFFGWYPARKAASLDPIEAIRYE